MTPEATDREIADEALPEQVPELAVPIALDRLDPWHSPRKQLVREKQWIYFSRRLINQEKGTPGLPEHPNAEPQVRVLTLPGIDYLDVRQFADVCRELGCCLTSTGFLERDEENRRVARAQIREQSLIDAGLITGNSYTFPRRLEDIVSTGSQAYRDLKRRGPFHIVNIDACGSIAAPSACDESRLIEAVYRIVELQLELNRSRWLLFVTADVRPGSIAQETLRRLCNAIFQNAEANDEFRNRALPLLDPEGTDIRAAAEAAAGEAGTTFLRLFGLGIAKWFLGLARSKDWDMKTHHPFCYSTMPRGDETPSMACLAFEFLPPPPGLQDPHGVVLAKPAPGGRHADTSIRAAEKMEGMANADYRLREDERLRSRLTETLRNLLEEAGYPPPVLAEIGR